MSTATKVRCTCDDPKPLDVPQNEDCELHDVVYERAIPVAVIGCHFCGQPGHNRWTCPHRPLADWLGY